MTDIDATVRDALVRVEWPMAGCACLTLNRPGAMNALSSALRQTLVSAIDRLCADSSARVLIVTGAGKAFCAGLDLKELGSRGAQGVAATATEAEDPVSALRRFPGPVIGAINGPAITGGFELALACDVLIASRDAWFADTHARVGVMPGWGLSQRLSRLIGPGRAKAVALTGRPLFAHTAERWGLVERTVDGSSLLDEALRLAKDMLAMQPAMLPEYKRVIDEGFSMDLDSALRFERVEAERWTELIAMDRTSIDAALPVARVTESEDRRPLGSGNR